MKPVVIIAIAVVCSVVAVLGVLLAIDMYNQMESQMIQEEYDRELYRQQQLMIMEQKQFEQQIIEQNKALDNWEHQWRNDCAEKYIGQLDEYYGCIENTNVWP
ncbi:MAG: hypothetical protein HOB51_01520 [Thaumarchaeota archaeon]|nr:hypothetical protein [Nitrososphaerota archaeon]